MLDIPRSLLLTVSLFGAATVLTAQSPKPTPAATKPAETPKETYAVVEMGHHLKAMTTTAEAAMEKEKHDSFQKSMAEYEKARAAAEAAKQPFTGKAPQEEKIEVKKAGIATMAEAEKFIEELKKAEKPMEKPKEKPKAPPVKRK